jgi:hypothetical protein
MNIIYLTYVYHVKCFSIFVCILQQQFILKPQHERVLSLFKNNQNMAYNLKSAIEGNIDHSEDLSIDRRIIL